MDAIDAQDRIEAMRGDFAFHPQLSNAARSEIVTWIATLPERPVAIRVRLTHRRNMIPVGDLKVSEVDPGPLEDGLTVSELHAQDLERRISTLLEGADLGDVSPSHALSLRLDARGKDGAIGGRQWVIRPPEPQEVRAPVTRESAQAEMLRGAAEVMRSVGESQGRVVDSAGAALTRMAESLGALSAENERLSSENRDLRRDLIAAKEAEARALAGQAPEWIQAMEVLAPMAPALLAALKGKAGATPKPAPKLAPKDAPKPAPRQITAQEAEEVFGKVWDALSPEDQEAMKVKLMQKAMGAPA